LHPCIAFLLTKAKRFDIVKTDYVSHEGQKDQEVYEAFVAFFFSLSRSLIMKNIYIASENRLDQRVSHRHTSVATELELIKSLKLFANAGIQRNNIDGLAIPGALILGGCIHSITDNFALTRDIRMV